MKNKLAEFFRKIASNTFFIKIKNFIKNHKLWSFVIIVAIIVGGYFSYSKLFTGDTVVQYTFEKVTRSDLVVSVDGSGQVSTLSKVSIKPNTTLMNLQ